MIWNLSQFIPFISSARNIYSNIIFGRVINKDNILELNSLNDSFTSIDIIESDIISLILNNSIDQKDLILNSLWKELNSITESFYNNKRIFAEFDIPRNWNHDIKSLEAEIEYQHQKTQKASDEVREISNSYEMTPFNGMPQNEVEILERRREKLTNEYNKEKEKLNKLYDEKNQIKDLILNIPDNLFKIISHKSESLIPIVQKYLDQPQKSTETINGDKSKTYFPMNLVSSIYEVCNGKQFEEIPEIDFFHSINLFPNYKPITPKKGEKTRICYLINQLSNTLSQEKKDQWLKDFLKLIGIEYAFYRAKYRDAVGDLPSEANQEFADALKEIFQKNK